MDEIRAEASTKWVKDRRSLDSMGMKGRKTDLSCNCLSWMEPSLASWPSATLEVGQRLLQQESQATTT
eukprot:7705685-Prorocentrum_lima.AAC.1